MEKEEANMGECEMCKMEKEPEKEPSVDGCGVVAAATWSGGCGGASMAAASQSKGSEASVVGPAWEYRGGVWVEGLGQVVMAHGNWASLPAAVQEVLVRKLRLLRPRALWIVDGSEREAAAIRSALADDPAFIPLAIPRNSAILRSPPDTHPVRIFTSTPRRDQTEADIRGVTSSLAHWLPPDKAEMEIRARFPGCMRGRTLYVVPFSLGPYFGCPTGLAALELTDYPQAVLLLRILVRVGIDALFSASNPTQPLSFITCVHSIGLPLPGECKQDAAKPPKLSPIVIHRPFESLPDVWSFGSGYGGNAVLSKKSLCLRMASSLAAGRGWFPAHMAVFSVRRLSDGVERWFGAVFPAACGKSQLAFMEPPSHTGLAIRCLSDDIAWLRRHPHTGRICALNPEVGVFTLLNGVNANSNPRILKALSRGNAIFTNTAYMRQSGQPTWSGVSCPENGMVEDWLGMCREAASDAEDPLSEPGARVALPLRLVPGAEMRADDFGVPLDAILFGSHRSSRIPLVYEASHLTTFEPKPQLTACRCSPWVRGAFIGASLRTEEEGPEGEANLRHQPFAAGPYLSVPLAQATRDWLELGSGARDLPRIYHVNWYRANERTGNLLWPGFAENARVVEWMMRRLDEGPAGSGQESGTGQLSMLGIIPRPGTLDLSGLDVNAEALFDQTYIEVAAETTEAVDWIRATAGPNFPEELLRCACQLAGIGFPRKVSDDDRTQPPSYHANLPPY